MAKETEQQKVEKQALQAVLDYYALSKLLFGMGDNSPYDVNEIEEKSPFYKEAVAIAEELEIDWKKMTHEQSNRIMLALLDEYYNRIKVDDKFTFSMVVKAKSEG